MGTNGQTDDVAVMKRLLDHYYQRLDTIMDEKAAIKAQIAAIDAEVGALCDQAEGLQEVISALEADPWGPRGNVAAE